PGLGAERNDAGNLRGRTLRGERCRLAPGRHDHGHLSVHQISRHGWQAVVVTIRPAELNRDVLPLDEAALGQAVAECGDEVRRILRRARAHETDDRDRRLLRLCRKRPRRRSAESQDELPPPHSITSSASADSEGGTVIPSALAVLRLMISSNFVGCSTGSSLGPTPRRILSTYSAAL